MPNEVWKELPDAPLYEVSDRGRFRSWNIYGKRGPIPHMKAITKRMGYASVRYRCDGEDRQVYLRSLVLELFVGPRPPGMVARCRIKGDRMTCRLKAIYWGYPENDQKQGVYNFKLLKKDVRKIRRYLAEGLPHKLIADKFGITPMTINRIKRGESWARI